MAEEMVVNPDAQKFGIDLTPTPEAAASPPAEEARQEDVRPDQPASEPTPAPEPAAGPSEVDRQQDRVRDLEERLERAERDYGASSKEAKRLAERAKEADRRLSTLKEKYALDELEDWKPEPQSQEDRTVTFRDLQVIEEQQRWRSAEETFFGSEKNADLASPIVKRWVRALLFTEDGGLVHPRATPREAFELAAKEARKILNSERLRGRQEREMAREEIIKSAVAEGTGKRPEPKPEPVEEKPNENEYYDLWKKRKERRSG